MSIWIRTHLSVTLDISDPMHLRAEQKTEGFHF